MHSFYKPNIFRKKVTNQLNPSVAGYHCISDMFQKDILNSWDNGTEIPVENRRDISIDSDDGPPIRGPCGASYRSS